MDFSSDISVPCSSPPLNPFHSSDFTALSLSEELKSFFPELPLPVDFYNVGVQSSSNAQVSSNFDTTLKKNTAFLLDSAGSVEELEFLDAQFDFRVLEKVAHDVGFLENQNVGIDGIIEPNPTPQSQVQKTHCRDKFETKRTNGLVEEKGLEIATVSVDIIRNKRPFKCMHAECKKTFKNPQTLSMHHKTHYRKLSDGLFVNAAKAGQNKKIPCRCPVCGQSFVGLYELRRHFGRKHSEGEKMHNCWKCGKKFYIEVDLRDHEKLCGEPVGCKCGLKFAFKCNLSAHKRSHPECVE